MTAMTLTIVIGLALRIVAPLALVLGLGTLAQALLERRPEVKQ